MPFFNLVAARMLIDAESRDHALEKFLSAHKSGIEHNWPLDQRRYV